MNDKVVAIGQGEVVVAGESKSTEQSALAEKQDDGQTEGKPELTVAECFSPEHPGYFFG